MFDTPVNHGRPSREWDGEGGVETLGSTSRLWIDVELHNGEVTAIFDANEDVRVGDLLSVANEP